MKLTHTSSQKYQVIRRVSERDAQVTRDTVRTRLGYGTDGTCLDKNIDK